MLPLDNVSEIHVDAEEIRALKTLHDAVRAGFEVENVIIQDEFTHDVILKVADQIYAVFDST